MCLPLVSRVISSLGRLVGCRSLLIVSLLLTTHMTVAQEGCVHVSAGEDVERTLLLTNMCLEGRTLQIKTGQRIHKTVCVKPGEATPVPRKQGEIIVVDKGEC